MPAKPLEVVKITVRPGRLVCDVRIPDASRRYVTPQLAESVRAAFPTIAGHACVNGVGPTFGCVMDRTGVPHLIEHIAIELQVRASDDPHALFTGTTEWADEGEGTACVQVSFKDDLQALRAFNEAVIFINEAMLT